MSELQISKEKQEGEAGEGYRGELEPLGEH